MNERQIQETHRGPSSIIRMLSIATVAVASVLLQGCATLAEHDKTPSAAKVAAPDSELRTVADHIDRGPGESVFRPMPFSDYAMDARLTLIRHAAASIDVQYYLVGNDATGIRSCAR